MAKVVVRPRSVVMLLLTYCLMYFPLSVGALWLSNTVCPFLVCNVLEEEEKTCCFAIIVLQMYCYYKCSTALPNGAVGWSAVCDCGIS